MSTNRSPGSGDIAVSDADLIRYLDGELTLDERQQLDAVLAMDAALTQRLSVLRRRSARLSTLLAAASPGAFETAAANPAPAPAGVTPISAARTARMTERREDRRARATSGERIWLRAAIVLLAVLGTAMAVPPVRAWVVDRLERIAGNAVTEPAESPPQPAPAPPTENFSVSFAIDGPSFVVEIMASQMSGRLTLRSGEAAEGRADVQGEYAGESFVVISARQTLRIQNTPASRANYIVALPSNVREVSVRLADGREVQVTLGSGTTERVIELSR
jgi:hypothetical protein